MRFPLDFLPMALCGLATIVAVAIVVVASDLLRRFVLHLIARFEHLRASRTARTTARPSPGGAPPEPVSRSETLPG